MISKQLKGRNRKDLCSSSFWVGSFLCIELAHSSLRTEVWICSMKLHFKKRNFGLMTICKYLGGETEMSKSTPDLTVMSAVSNQWVCDTILSSTEFTRVKLTIKILKKIRKKKRAHNVLRKFKVLSWVTFKTILCCNKLQQWATSWACQYPSPWQFHRIIHFHI